MYVKEYKNLFRGHECTPTEVGLYGSEVAQGEVKMGNNRSSGSKKVYIHQDLNERIEKIKSTTVFTFLQSSNHRTRSTYYYCHMLRKFRSRTWPNYPQHASTPRSYSFPSRKTTLVIGILKPLESLSHPSSYRPTSLLSIILNNRLTWSLKANECLSQSQFGCRGKRWTLMTLADLYAQIHEAHTSDASLFSLFFDMENAFPPYL